MSDLKAYSLVRDIPDFPQAGILFRDITPILTDAEAFAEVVDRLADAARGYEPDVVVGIESRGFLFGTPLALKIGRGFAPIRKMGKLPYKTITEEYALEYGVNTVEMHVDAIAPGQRVVIVDDLLATGGTAAAAAALIRRAGGVVAGYCFVVELEHLGGREKIAEHPITALIHY